MRYALPVLFPRVADRFIVRTRSSLTLYLQRTNTLFAATEDDDTKRVMSNGNTAVYTSPPAVALRVVGTVSVYIWVDRGPVAVRVRLGADDLGQQTATNVSQLQPSFVAHRFFRVWPSATQQTMTGFVLTSQVSM